MKIVKLFTLVGYFNYGNKLQNFAIQYVIETNFSIKVYTSVYKKTGVSSLYCLSHICRNILKNTVKAILDAMCKIFNIKTQFQHGSISISDFIRMKQFKIFNDKYIHMEKINDFSNNLSRKADYFVVGSDQVWNAKGFRGHDKEAFLLTFAKDNQKVCFSPSFGVSSLPEEWKLWFKKYLSLFPYISVREEAGAKIIKELTGKEAEVLIDPTMMLSSDEWMKIAEKPKKIDCDKNYMLVYFLGQTTIDYAGDDLKKYAEKYNIEIYNLHDKKNPKLYCTDPSEFIYLISKAKLVVTDSFHGSVFSFLFNKPFLVYERKEEQNSKIPNMMSRIDTLLKKFNLERKYVGSGLPNKLFECDYQEGCEQLELERKKVMDFLKKSFRMDEK